ncbi:T9SS type A sorting domain-containing protein [Flavobacterium sp.]|uniref:T9SS type A sorting domain-containing protein n=1 Tax=Flavobacterium sp. TaxID=239 RepID=UPI00286D9F61|nr:T9SS type A sorting domain-containing protein [Flavobacterium sp.]
MKLKTILLVKINIAILFFALMTLTSNMSFGQNNGQGQYLTGQQLQHTSGNRVYAIYIPVNYNSAQPAPLVLLFHGFTNNISTMFNDSQMQALADANNFIYAIPQGLGTLAGWNIGLSFGGSADDIGFTRSLIDRIALNYSINPKKVYAAGFSNGGFFSYKLACELSDKIAAIASVAGSMNPSWITGSNPTCNPQHQMPVMQITGSNDTVIPIAGGNGGTALSNVFNYWINFNNTTTTPSVTNINSVSTRKVYNGGENGATVEFIEIGGRGHEWPRITTAGLRENASIRIWDFFSKYDIDGQINPLSSDSFNKTGFSIYPNPTESAITINNINFIENSSYSIISVTGQVVLNGELTEASQRIDISTLSPNIYFLNIGNNTFKIVKT